MTFETEISLFKKYNGMTDISEWVYFKNIIIIFIFILWV